MSNIVLSLRAACTFEKYAFAAGTLAFGAFYFKKHAYYDLSSVKERDFFFVKCGKSIALKGYFATPTTMSLNAAASRCRHLYTYLMVFVPPEIYSSARKRFIFVARQKTAMRVNSKGKRHNSL